MKQKSNAPAWAGLVAALVLNPGPLAAQNPDGPRPEAPGIAQPPAPPPPAPSPRLEVGQRGIRVSSPDGAFQFDLRALAQFDGRFFLEGDGADTFLVRRLRPTLSGKLYEHFQFRITPELATQVNLLDAWLNYAYNPALQIQAGIFKAPYGLERLQSGAAIHFVERGLPTNLVPARDQGVQIHGGFAASGLSYAVAVLNGAQNGARPDSDTDDNVTLGGRIFWEPVGGFGKGLGIGIGGSYGNEQTTAALPGQRSPGQVTFFSYEGTVRADGTRYRINPHVYYYTGPFGLLAEWVRDSQEVARGGLGQTVETDAWLIQASWVLTGENASYNGVRPSAPFSPGGSLGAWELVARVHGLEVGDEVFAGDPATTRLANPATQDRSALAYGVGVNWYLNNNVKVALNLDHTSFSDGEANRDDELALFTRVQFNF